MTAVGSWPALVSSEVSDSTSGISPVSMAIGSGLTELMFIATRVLAGTSCVITYNVQKVFQLSEDFIIQHQLLLLWDI